MKIKYHFLTNWQTHKSYYNLSMAMYQLIISLYIYRKFNMFCLNKRNIEFRGGRGCDPIGSINTNMNYLYSLSPLTLCDEVCRWFATCLGFSLGTPVSSNNKTDHHNIAEILLKVALNTMTHPSIFLSQAMLTWVTRYMPLVK